MPADATASAIDGGTVQLPAFSVALDDLWTAVDPGQLGDRAALEATIAERVADEHLSREEGDGILELASRWAGEPAVRDLAFMAVLTAYDEESGLVVGSLSITFHTQAPAPVAGADASPASDDPVEGITLRSRAKAADAVPTSPAAPSPVRLPSDIAVARGGRSAAEVVVDGRPGWRTAEVARLTVSEGVAQEIFTVQYVLPTDDPATTLIATATSPALASREALEQVFDRALSTIELYAPQAEPAPAT